MAKILWVDDEIDLLKPHIYFLKEKGYEVVTASNGKDAVEYIKENNVDVILLDEMMPGLDGLTTLEMIKEIRQNVPVIMITKSEEEGLMDEAISKHITDYLLKPVNPKQILLALKKVLEKNKIIESTFGLKYSNAMRNLNSRLYDRLSPADWADIYTKLVQIEMEIDDFGQRDFMSTHKSQKVEFNEEFTKYVENNYVSWIYDESEERPTLSPDLFRKYVFPRLKNKKKKGPVYFVLLDCARLDQFIVLEEYLSALFNMRKEYYYSIIPTATPYSRNSIFSGMMPLDIGKKFPEVWSDPSDKDVSLNRFERQLMDYQFQQNKVKLNHDLKYLKLFKFNEGKELLSKVSSFGNLEFASIVVNFIDTLTHGRSHNEILKEIAPDEAAFRTLTKSWFLHSDIYEAFKLMKKQNATVILTSDHGSILCNRPTTAVGRKDTTTTLRYKYGQNLNYESKCAIKIEKPSEYKLYSQNDFSDNYIIAKNDYFFVYPNNYHEYVKLYEGSFQHGGISLEEMILPVYVMES